MVVSDGLDNHSRHSRGEVLDASKESDTLVYSFARASETGGGISLSGSDDDHLLRDLSESTGGLVYRHGSPIDQAIADLRSRYVLAFAPTDKTKDGRYHRLKVTVKPDSKQSKMYVHARTGYYAVEK